ncbi:hypothetical protein V6Z12_A11G234200 [Gossypium hirsutum]
MAGLENYLPLVEFAYNNSYQSKLKESKIFGVNLIKETEHKVKVIQDCLKAAKEIEYQVGDKVFLKVSPRRKVLRFGRKGKLSPHFIRPYEITERIGPAEIQLDMTYGKEPVKILAREVKQLMNKSIALVKVLRHRLGVEEASWEVEETMRSQYLNLFTGKTFKDESP